MKRYLKILLSIFLLFTVLSLLLFWPIFAGKVNLNGNLLVSFYAPFGENLPYKNSGWDQLRIYFPFYKVTLEAIKNFEVPLWNPYAFSGHPHMADFQSAVFYPLNIFGLFLPQIEFWHLLRITPMILAAFFTFLYLSLGLALSRLASIFGAVTFGFSPFILTWGEEVVMSPHSIIWLPLILFAIERFLVSPSRHPELVSGSDSRFHGNDRNGLDRNDNKKYLVIISLATAASFFGGYMQTSIYMFIFVAFYFLFRIKAEKKFEIKKVFGIISAFVLGTGIAAVQLMPAAELFLNAARSQVTLREQLLNFLLPIESLLTYLAPDFFGHPATHNFFRFGDAQYYEGIMFVGVATLVFATYMILRGKEKWLVRFLAISGLLALLATIDWFGARLFLSLPIPFLSTSIPNRVLFIPAFCLAVLAAGGFDRWLRYGDRNIFKAVLVITGAYGGVLVTLVLVNFFGISYFEHKQFFSEANWLVTVRNLVIPLAVFVIVASLILAPGAKLKNIAALVIIIVSFLHIFYFSQKYFSFSHRERIFPENEILNFIKEGQGYFRSWGVGDTFFENNFASQYLLFWPEGYDSLNNRSYGEFTYAMQGADISDFIFRADAGIGRGTTVELIRDPNRRRLVDMVGVKYVLGKSDEERVMSLYSFKKVFAEGKYAVFVNQTVMPRAFLASNYEGPSDIFGSEPATDEERLRRKKERRKLIPQKLLRGDFDWRSVIILEKPSPISAQFGPGTAQIVEYKPTEVVVKTQSREPKILFLSDNFYPGWKATVDGDETEIFRANYTFRAVPLIGGEHEVRFYYDSWVFKVGLTISLVSLGLLGIILAKSRLRD
ncbi:MAG: YfhO family protein [Patescibacteria group bacterium]